MARTSKTLTPAAMAAFLAALESGALVAAAAREAKVAVSTLYYRRQRDPDFAEAWEMAADARGGALRPRPAPGQASSGQAAGKKRRMRFDAGRRAAFLDYLAITCNTTDAADYAGVHRSAVYRRIARDPDFARAVAAALRRGFARIEGEAARERAAAAARPHREIVATGEPTADFDEALKLLARWERRDGSLGPRCVRHGHQKRWPFDKAIEALAKQLRWMGVLPPREPPVEGDSGL